MRTDEDAMRRLILLRHAKSDWPPGMVDHDRPLAARGRRAAPLIGRWLVDNGFVPDRAVVSTASKYPFRLSGSHAFADSQRPITPLVRPASSSG